MAYACLEENDLKCVNVFKSCAKGSINHEHIELQNREEVLHIDIAWLFLWIR